MAIASAERETIFNSPHKVHDKFITADGYRTHYIEAGDPASHPLVLVHGGANEIGMGVDRWYPTIIPLAKDFHVFAVDEIGHGQSDPPRDIAHIGHVRYRAEHVLAFIEALNVGPVYLVGQSQGGWIGTWITLSRPDLVDKFVLVDSASTAGAGMDEKGLPYFQNVFEPGTMIPKEGLTTTSEGIRTYVQEFVYDKAMVNDELVDRLMVLSKRWNALYMPETRKMWASGPEKAREMYDVDGTHISNSVHKISRPTLVIWGRQSNKGLDNGVELYKKIPDAEMYIFDKASHFVWLDQPEKFNSLVTWYLNREV